MAREAFLAAALLFGARAAGQVAPPPGSLAVASPRTPHPVVEEHELRPADAGAASPRPDEDLPPLPEWSWPREHLEGGRAFADPFIGPEVYPELSAGIQVRGGRAGSSRSFLYDQQVALNLYLVEVRFPLVAYRSRSNLANQVFLDAKIPLALGPMHRLAFVWGVAIPGGTPARTKNSRGEVLYAFGSRALTAQLKLGYGYEPIFIDEPLRQAVLFGALVGLRLGRFQPVLQVDGSRSPSAGESRLALAPGLWFYPLSNDAVQLGASALVVLSGDGEGQTRRAGALATLSYNFL